MATSPIQVVKALYGEFLDRGIRYFFPAARLVAAGPAPTSSANIRFSHRTDGQLELEWFGERYRVDSAGETFGQDELRLLGAIAHVLAARYRSIFSASSAAAGFLLFKGVPEDRYVSAFLEPAPYLDDEGVPEEPDVVAEAIDVLRESSLATYENRRISTGVLLYGAQHGSGADAHRPRPPSPEGALLYNSSLASIKSFHRLCDGLHTVALVNPEGLLADVVDVAEWAGLAPVASLPAPTWRRYRAHSLATISGGHVCLVLTPNGEIKIFAEGTQVFNFLDGRWRLTDLAEKYHCWQRAVGNRALAERLFSASLNLAENRRGGLFVVLHDPRSAQELLSPADLLSAAPVPMDATRAGSKDQLHYLLRGRRALDIEQSVLETIASMDGGVVLDRASKLLAFGAILRNDRAAPAYSLEGGRTIAAVSASHYGPTLKISEDGQVSFYIEGRPSWQI